LNAKIDAKLRRREDRREGKANMSEAWNFRGRTESKVDPEIEDLATEAIGAAIEVHRILGPGFSESVYRKAMSVELTLRGIAHVCESPVPLLYKDEPVGFGSVDILVDGKLILELKVVEQLAEIHRKQASSYLLALNLPLALLMNFNVTVIRDGIRRVIESDQS